MYRRCDRLKLSIHETPRAASDDYQNLVICNSAKEGEEKSRDCRNGEPFQLKNFMQTILARNKLSRKTSAVKRSNAFRSYNQSHSTNIIHTRHLTAR